MDKLNNYEVMYIIDIDTEDSVKNELQAKLKDTIISGGKLISEDVIGKKELAYEINKKNLGHYVLLNVTATPEAVAEFNRLVNIEKPIVRYLVIKK